MLSDVADANEHWYSFEAFGSNKLSIIFSQQASGDYDIALYQLVGNTLNLVSYSANEGTSEKISYIAEEGAYFLAVLPNVAATTPYNFNFIVDVLSSYDAYESNDFPGEATPFVNSFNVTANLDSMFDEDWYKISLSTSRKIQISMTGAPAGNHYGIFLYDGSLASLGSFLVDGSAMREVKYPAGDYYLRVLSYTGTLATTNYKLSVAKPPGTIATGQFVDLNGNTLTIDGVAAQINGEYMNYSTPSYRATEEIMNAGNLTFIDGKPVAYSHTYYVDGVGMRTSPVVVLDITNGYYHCFNGNNGYWSHYFDTDATRPLESQTTVVPSIRIVVSLDTGKVVDNKWSMHYLLPVYGGMQWKEPTEIK